MNDGSEIAVPENMVEKSSVDEVIKDREDNIDKNEVIIEFTKNIMIPGPVPSTPSLIMFRTRTSDISSRLSLLALTLPQYPRISTSP